MAEYGVLDTGFARKPLEVIDAEVEAALRAISDQITLEADDPFAQAVLVLTGKISEVWEVLEAADAAQDPDRARGAQLDAAAALSGSRRRDATYSKVTALVDLDAGANIAVGAAIASVAGFPDRRFVNAEAMVNGGGSGVTDVPILFIAEDPGPVAAPSGTLTVRETSPTGWTAVTNDDDATLGRDVEKDSELKIRREQELQALGGGTVDGIRGDFLQLDDVLDAIVLENTTMLTDPVTGLPPKSFEVIIDDGGLEGAGAVDETHGEIVWRLKPAGIETYGEETEQVTDSRGKTQTVHYSYVTEVSVYMRLLVTYDASVFATGTAANDAAEAAILAAAIDAEDDAFLGIGIDARARKLACAALHVPGILDVEAVVGTGSIGSLAAGFASVVIDDRSKAALDTKRFSYETAVAEEP